MSDPMPINPMRFTPSDGPSPDTSDRPLPKWGSAWRRYPKKQTPPAEGSVVKAPRKGPRHAG